MLAPKCSACSEAEVVGRVAHVGQDGARDAKQRQQLVVPGVAADVVEQGAAGVGRVGRVDRAAGQPPQQERIDRAEGEFAALGARPCAGDIVEQPGDLGRREIRVEQQSRARCDQRLVPRGAQPLADVGGAAVLPDDRAMDRRAGLAVPDQRRLALVGDADRRQLGRANAGLGQRLAAGRQRRAPDVFGVVLDPAGSGIMLGEFLLRRGDDRSARNREQDGARRSGALVDRQHVRHFQPPCGAPPRSFCTARRVRARSRPPLVLRDAPLRGAPQDEGVRREQKLPHPEEPAQAGVSKDEDRPAATPSSRRGAGSGVATPSARRR